MKSEHSWLIDFFVNVAAFEAVTSTFTLINKEEKEELNSAMNNLKQVFEKILPQVANREMLNGRP